MTNFHGDEAKFFLFLEKKNSKWLTQKKVIFQNRQFSIFFCENFDLEQTKVVMSLLKKSFFESAILNFFFKKKKNFASSPWKSVANYLLEWMGLNFYGYDGLQPKTTPPKHISRQCIQSCSYYVSKMWYYCTKECHMYMS